jgi:plasmid stabilization system protein ParE
VAVLWFPGAQEEFRILTTRISRYSPNYAAALRNRIVGATSLLNDLPRMGRVVPELGNETFREPIVDNYRVLYRLEDDGVGIVGVGVIDGRRAFENWLNHHPEVEKPDA